MYSLTPVRSPPLCTQRQRYDAEREKDLLLARSEVDRLTRELALERSSVRLAADAYERTMAAYFSSTGMGMGMGTSMGVGDFLADVDQWEVRGTAAAGAAGAATAPAPATECGSVGVGVGVGVGIGTGIQTAAAEGLDDFREDQSSRTQTDKHTDSAAVHRLGRLSRNEQRLCAQARSMVRP